MLFAWKKLYQKTVLHLSTIEGFEVKIIIIVKFKLLSSSVVIFSNKIYGVDVVQLLCDAISIDSASYSAVEKEY